MKRLNVDVSLFLRGNEVVRPQTSDNTRWITITQPDDDDELLFTPTTVEATLFFPDDDEDRLLACDTLIAALEQMKATVRTSVRS